MSTFRRVPDEHVSTWPGDPDADPHRSRPQRWTRRNAEGEEFHTYVDPDRFPATARADEALWQAGSPIYCCSRLGEGSVLGADIARRRYGRPWP